MAKERSAKKTKVASPATFRSLLTEGVAALKQIAKAQASQAADLREIAKDISTIRAEYAGDWEEDK